MRPRSHAEITHTYELLQKARKALFAKTVLAPARERALRRRACALRRALHAAGYLVG